MKSPSWGIRTIPPFPAVAERSSVMPDFLSEPQRWVIPAILLVSAVGTVLALWWERRRPSSYRRRWEAEMAEWRAMPAKAQAAHDEAALNAAEAAENVAARSNALYRP